VDEGGAVRGQLARDGEVVLHRDRDAEQRRVRAGAQPGVGGIGLGERGLAADRAVGAQGGVEAVDALEVVLGEPARGQAAVAQMLGQARGGEEGEVAVHAATVSAAAVVVHEAFALRGLRTPLLGAGQLRLGRAA
jgi:hypothetical protein